MRTRIASFIVLLALIAGAVMLFLRFRHEATPPVRHEYPVEGLVIRDDGRRLFEKVPPQDRQMLQDLGFPKALGSRDAERVRHLVIYLDCHYFFIADGRVLVMTISGGGQTPRLVETKRWQGTPHDFGDYHKDLLPST